MACEQRLHPAPVRPDPLAPEAHAELRIGRARSIQRTGENDAENAAEHAAQPRLRALQAFPQCGHFALASSLLF